jgi:hypothetical protein
MELTRETVLQAIETSDQSAVNALIKLYARQTADEQQSQATRHDNGVGFNGTDSAFLSSLAEQAIARRADRKAGKIPAHWTDLSPRQMTALRKAIKKYAGQLLQIAEDTQAANAAKRAMAPTQSAPTAPTAQPLAYLPSGYIATETGWRVKTARDFYAEGCRLDLTVDKAALMARNRPISEFEEVIGVGA